MLKLENATFKYEPYPLALIAPAFEDGVYEEMLANWPSMDWCRVLGRKGQLKYYLNESKTAEKYRDFVQSVPVWREFHKYVKSRQFIDGVLSTLEAHNIDLGQPRPMQWTYKRVRTSLGDVFKRRKLPDFPSQVYTRFEFSMLPDEGGAVLPHTDDPKKISTIVLYMAGEDEWDRSWGGGLDVVMPKDKTQIYNHTNRKLPFEDVEVLHTYDYRPNRGILFVKTFNSWHQVRPIQGKGPGAKRRTLTINFETN